jgi:xanthosine utilization system XapX-like protein
MPTFNGTITYEQIEAAMSQAFWDNSRDVFSRSVPFIVIVAALVAWPMAGFQLPEPGPSFAMVGLIGLCIIAAIWCWGWARLRREIVALRRTAEKSGVLPHTAAPLTLTMEADGIAWGIERAAESQPWSAMTRIQETKDFLLPHFGRRAQVILPKAGFASEDLAAIRIELDRRLPKT